MRAHPYFAILPRMNSSETQSSCSLTVMNTSTMCSRILVPNLGIHTFFCPSLRHRGTINNFLSLDRFFFDEAYDDDPDAALYDVEQSVEQELDNWISRVTNVEEARAQLEVLMDKYMMKAHTWSEDLEDTVCLSGY